MLRTPHPDRCPALRLLAPAALLALMLGGDALAAPSVDAPGRDGAEGEVLAEQPQPVEQQQLQQTSRELEQIGSDLEAAKAREARLRGEIAELDEDLARLNAALIRTASEEQSLEEQSASTEARLAKLVENESRIKVSLDQRRAVLADFLSGMMRLGRRPPPAIVVSAEDALGSVRSALLLGSLFPELRIEADALATDLGALRETRTALAREGERLEQERQALLEERQRTALLIEERDRVRQDNRSALAEAQQQAEALASRATSLRELIETLQTNIAAVREAAVAARAAEAARAEEQARLVAEAARSGEAPPVDAPAERLRDTARIAPAIPFADARGLLPKPARGVALRGWGEQDTIGEASQGLSIATRAGARVIAPTDGWVVYAGAFRSYGQLLILDAGDGYHVVLAGMERIDAQLGQFVLLGEPVAEMGNRSLTTSLGSAGRAPQPLLYVEFRKDGQAIDPAPWWADDIARRTGG